MQWGCLNTRAEIIPTEPDPGNAGEGRAKGMRPTPLVSLITKISKNETF